MNGSGARRDVLAALLAAMVAVPAGTGLRLVDARRWRKRRRKRCRHRCKQNRKTCVRACGILDDDSEELCRQGCRIGQSQCRANC